MARLRIRTTVAALGAVALLVTGCSSGEDGDKLITIDPATAAQSPETTRAPDGTVHPLTGRVDSITFDPITRTAVIVEENSRTLTLVPADALSSADPAAAGRQIPLDGDVRGVTITADGTALLAMDQQVVRLDTATGEQNPLSVDGRANSVVELPDGRLAVGTDAGKIEIIDPGSDQTHTISGLASVDELAVTDGHLSALDHRQTSLTAINLDSYGLGIALRAGEGATHLTTDRFGRVLITDTTGDELLVFTADPLLMHQRYPVGLSPYAIAYDETADRVWVTLTATNEVVGFDLSSGIPVETGRFRTVRQPNSLAVDSESGNLIVGSGTGDGLQIIPSRTN
ncbi:DNA-binding beta-propeller fold protein YncE [Rhodococcus sp. 27YEA15]|uniref:hypothetical protein n=1 Tax=Rhodococcus sp. 27YEA15 TaxID=3156259 RepID=UPI003C7B38E1